MPRAALRLRRSRKQLRVLADQPMRFDTIATMSRLLVVLFTATSACTHIPGEQPNAYTEGPAVAPKPSGPPRSPKGSTRVVLVNSSIYPVCSVTFGAPPYGQDNVMNWDALADPAAVQHKIGTGQSMEIGVQPGRYGVLIESCDHKYSGTGIADVRGATAITIGHPGPPDRSVVGLAQVSVELLSSKARARANAPAGAGPAKRDCLPGGDMSTGIASECCTGVILISAKRPNMPSHCAFPDEVE